MTSIDAVLTAAIAQIEATAVQRMDEAIARVEQRMLEQLYVPLGPWLNKEDAATYIGVSLSTLSDRMARNEIPVFYSGHRPVFSQRHLDEYITNSRADGVAPTPLTSERRRVA